MTFDFLDFLAFFGFVIFSTFTERICVQSISVDPLYEADTVTSCAPGEKLWDLGFLEVMIFQSSYVQV